MDASLSARPHNCSRYAAHWKVTDQKLNDRILATVRRNAFHSDRAQGKHVDMEASIVYIAI
jgi:hypothetical protein